MSKDDQTILNLCYLVFTILVGLVVYKGVQTVGVKTGLLERYDTWFPYAATGVAIFSGLGMTWFLRSNNERHEFFLSAVSEMRKVTWPSAIDTRKMTLIVCVVVVIFAIIVGVFDVMWAKTIEFLLS